jgi:polyvinyl alcohol dehydrogenase (cytochrome)
MGFRVSRYAARSRASPHCRWSSVYREPIRVRLRFGCGGLSGGIHFGIAVSQGRAFIPNSDVYDYQTHTMPAAPGLFSISVDDGSSLWSVPIANECNDREFCDPGIGAAITATPSLVFAGALDGYLRIHDAATGKIL